VLHAQNGATIVVASADRVAAAEHAIELGADVIVCDDGLQHYRLARNCEICVIDARRELGNRWVLPAGPLREHKTRLNSVDMLVRTERDTAPHDSLPTIDALTAHARLDEAVCLASGERRPLSAFTGTRVHAIAGIGNPGAFFEALRQAGIDVDAHAFADHTTFTAQDVSFADAAPILMTQKDAVKCMEFATERHWSVPLELTFSDEDRLKIEWLIDSVLRAAARTR
jgi:tetraacyldisaccharide 4'-kinase